MQQLWMRLSSQPIPTQLAAAPKNTKAAVQAADHDPSPPTVDLTVQADVPKHPHQPPPQSEQALHRTRTSSKRCWKKA